MAKINYRLPALPDNPNRFGFSSRPAVVEFDESTLSPEDLTLWQQHSAGFGTLGRSYTLKTYHISENDFSKSHQISSQDYQSETELTFESAWAIFKEVVNNRKQLEERLVALRQEDEAARLVLMEEKAAREKEAAEKRAAEEAKRRAEASEFNWKEDGTTITNLYERIMIVAALEPDSRFPSWVKLIDRIDTKYDNGYSFVGDFINDRTMEVDRDYLVFLACVTNGSRRSQTKTYAVVVMRNGKLEATNIRTTDEDAGWALLIREDVQKLLDAEVVNKVQQIQREAIIEALKAAKEAAGDSPSITISRELFEAILKFAPDLMQAQA